MKRIVLAIVILLAAGFVVYAQQGTPTKQDMQNYLNEVKSKTSDYDSMMEDIISNNSSSGLATRFARIKADIEKLEARIDGEVKSIQSVHDKDQKVGSQVIDSLQRDIDQRKAKQKELEDLLASS